jgi:hypothetical protein
MSDGISIDFFDFHAFSLAFDCVRSVLVRLFLVRNWCGTFSFTLLTRNSLAQAMPQTPLAGDAADTARKRAYSHQANTDLGANDAAAE